MWFPVDAEVGKLYVLSFQDEDIESTRYHTFNGNDERTPGLWLVRNGAVGLVIKQTKSYACVLVDDCIIRIDHKNDSVPVVMNLLREDFHPI